MSHVKKHSPASSESVLNSWSQVCLVGIVTRLQAGQSSVQIPVGTRDFSVLQNFQTGSGGPPSLLFDGY